MMWCRDVHKTLQLDTNRQKALVKFERKCFKLSTLLKKKIDWYMYNLVVLMETSYFRI